MHLILFGGSFDPPHNGHLAIAQNIVDQNIADQVIFIPCANHPFAKEMSPAHYRLAMLNLLPNITIDPYELNRKEKSYSFDTLRYFAEKHPQDEISWLIGSDQLQSFHKWHRYQELLDQFRVYVYPRANFPFEPLYSNMIPLREMEEINVSSTLVREAVHRGADIQSYVPHQITEYIRENALYNQNHA
ncbi:MAG: nicotinate (nicotinamide) nucleotide adenylyltransferase [Candidatus Pacebacteria bacterium]|nr:nicotinate (nicotinamide) nucleotide adenylyltransferase [Candidatus Paceibacterota bacterium]